MTIRDSIHKLDLRPLCEDAEHAVTILTLDNFALYNDEHPHGRMEWIQAGPGNTGEGRQDGGLWTISSRIKGLLDSEHKSRAYAFSIDVVGLQHRYTSNGFQHFSAYIEATDPRRFHVPPPDYDPFKTAHRCDGDCGRTDAPHHFTDKLWLPPPNIELFKLVRGWRVEIVMGYNKGLMEEYQYKAGK